MPLSAAENVAACRRKGKFQSFAGMVKIAGQPKTAWSLTQDSDDTHDQEPNLIRVDHCEGWLAGDAISIAATGGDQETFQGVRNWCNGEGCIPSENSKTEERVIKSVTEHADGACDVILTEALQMNHRGNAVGIASPDAPNSSGGGEPFAQCADHRRGAPRP